MPDCVKHSAGFIPTVVGGSIAMAIGISSTQLVMEVS